MKIEIQGVKITYKDYEQFEEAIKKAYEQLKEKKARLEKKRKIIMKQERAFKKFMGEIPKVKEAQSKEPEKVGQ